MSVVAEPTGAARAGRAVAPGSPVRGWDKGLARVLILLWVLATIGAWGLGTRMVSLEQLERDVESGAVQQMSLARGLDSSSWWNGASDLQPGDSVIGEGPGIVLYQTSSSPFARTFAVAPPGSVDGGLPGVSGFAAGMAEWGDRQADVERLVAQVQEQPRDPDSVDATWTNAIVPAFMVLGLLCSLAMLLSRRPERGNRWYWFWLMLIVPAGLGWAAYAWREYLARGAGAARASRDGGFTGFVLALAVAFLLAVVGIGLAGLLGITVLPA